MADIIYVSSKREAKRRINNTLMNLRKKYFKMIDSELDVNTDVKAIYSGTITLEKGKI